MTTSSENLDLAAIDKAKALQSGLIARATGGDFAGGEAAFLELRKYFLGRNDTKDKTPKFLRHCLGLAEFWEWIKGETGKWAERRKLIRDAFRPLIEYLDSEDRSPGTASVSTSLQALNTEYVQLTWQKALDRRASDPEGAITAARTLLETVCKHILDEAAIGYADDADLPKLWGLAAETLNLAPSQHHEETFKAILGSCQQIVNRLGTLRNKISDAHGQGKRAVRPKPRHAELAVNLAGAMAAFIVATWAEKSR